MHVVLMPQPREILLSRQTIGIADMIVGQTTDESGELGQWGWVVNVV